MKISKIKFRGKRIDTGEWIYGGYMLHQNVQLCIASKEEVEANKKHLIMIDGMADWNLSVPINGFEVDPETIGQFIGKTDKSGKDVFEGDIVDICRYESNDMFQNIVKDIRHIPEELLGSSFNWCEVRGNIHDNTYPL